MIQLDNGDHLDPEVIVVTGKLKPVQQKDNKDHTSRWIRGDFQFSEKRDERQLLRKINQNKLPFTFVTSRTMSVGNVVAIGNIVSHTFSDGGVWKTLNIQTVFDEHFDEDQWSIMLAQLPKKSQTGIRELCGNLKPLERLQFILSSDHEDAKALQESFTGSDNLAMVKAQLIPYLGSRNTFADQMVDIYGSDAFQVLRDDPWQLINVISYFTMDAADKVAAMFGYSLTDIRRTKAKFLNLLLIHLEGTKSNYLTQQQFDAFYWLHFSDALTLEEYQKMPDDIDANIVRTSYGIQPTAFYEAEKNTVTAVNRMLARNDDVSLRPHFQSVMTQTIQNASVPLTDEQCSAIGHGLINDLCIITGGPGTGKTTILKSVLQAQMDYYNCESKNIQLMAPTGKAAYRMFEQTQMEATTIHSALGIVPNKGILDVQKVVDRMIEQGIKLLVVDEASMLDTIIAGAIFTLLNEMHQNGHHLRLLLLGDKDQLPPVANGQVFKDLLTTVPKIELTIVKRQGVDSSIPELAQYIRNGQFPDEDWFNGRSDVIFVPTTMTLFKHTMVERILKPKLSALDTMQTLTPYRNGEKMDTMQSINNFVEPLYNQLEVRTEASYGAQAFGEQPVNLKTFAEGDKIINRTNITRTIVNGSVGTIIEINNQSHDPFDWKMLVAFEKEEYTFAYEEWKHIELAYALTIHASQGSEYPIVLLPILRPGYSDFLTRNLLYTGVTRASEKVVLLGNINLFRKVAQTPQAERKTGLQEMLK